VLPKLALVQGIFYVATGLWPLVHIVSFQIVTGPKTDLWLVRTVAVLVTVIGAVLLSAWHSRRISPEVILLAAGGALGLASIDLIYALSGTISSVYLADAMAELMLVALWLAGWRRRHG
jgi:hypothetical protein